MNLKKLTIVVGALLIFVFAGCKKDTNDPIILGQFAYLDKDYNLTHGVNVGYDPLENNVYGIDLILMSSGLQIFNSGDTASMVTSRGDVFDITMNTASVEGDTITGNYSGTLTYYNGAATKSILVK